MMQTIIHFFTKLDDALRHLAGWAIALGLIVADYFAGHAFVVFLVLATTLMDAVWGVAVSLHEKKFGGYAHPVPESKSSVASTDSPKSVKSTDILDAGVENDTDFIRVTPKINLKIVDDDTNFNS